MLYRLKYAFLLVCIVVVWTASAQPNKVEMHKDQLGWLLKVDSKNFMINGMNWDYYPVGTNYSYNLWEQSEEFIKKVLNEEMALLANMGVNCIRQYDDIPPIWVEYIYREFGIMTMVNHTFGRYGLLLNGNWTPHTDYGNPLVSALLLKEVKSMALKYKSTPGVLLYLIGNENNYGLFWEGAETENIPEASSEVPKEVADLYDLMNQACDSLKAVDQDHPVAICNGDLVYLDEIVKRCPSIDILGTNMYRGKSFDIAFDLVQSKLDKPLLFSELGADAFNAIKNKEDEWPQAGYLIANWHEIYSNAYGLKKAGNSLGGFTFQFSDGWWKLGQDKDLGVHNTGASWKNGGYKEDYSEQANNMNEEWFGICSKENIMQDGSYTLRPRLAYKALKEVHKIDLLNTEINQEILEKRIGNIFSAIQTQSKE